MDTKRIKELANMIENFSGLKFTGEGSHLRVENGGCIGTENAVAIAAELNAAIKPILSKVRQELKKQLALCGKE